MIGKIIGAAIGKKLAGRHEGTKGMLLGALAPGSRPPRVPAFWGSPSAAATSPRSISTLAVRAGPIARGAAATE